MSMKSSMIQNIHIHGDYYLQCDLTTSNETELIAIPGTRDLLHPPKGDAFARRSQYALDIDFKEAPPWFKVSPTHYVKSWLLDERAPKVEPPEMVKRDNVKCLIITTNHVE